MKFKPVVDKSISPDRPIRNMDKKLSGALNMPSIKDKNDESDSSKSKENSGFTSSSSENFSSPDSPDKNKPISIKNDFFITKNKTVTVPLSKMNAQTIGEALTGHIT